MISVRLSSRQIFQCSPAQSLRRWALPVLWMLLAVTSVSAADKLVLVSGTGTTNKAVPLSEVRRAFLGAVSAGGRQAMPIRNFSDAKAHQLFSEQVLTLSPSEYDRRLAMRSLQSGLTQLPTIRDSGDIERVLQDTPNSVTYMFESDAKKYKSLTVVQDLAPMP